MKMYKKEWEAFLIEYFQNKENVTREQLWMDVSNPNSRIYSIYMSTIKIKNVSMFITRYTEITDLMDGYGIINIDSYGRVHLSEEVKRREKIKRLNNDIV